MSSSEVDCKEVIGSISSEEETEDSTVNDSDTDIFASDEEYTEEVFLRELNLYGDSYRNMVNDYAEYEEYLYNTKWNEMMGMKPPPPEEIPKEPDVVDILFGFLERNKKLLKAKADLASNTADGTEPSPTSTSASTSASASALDVA